MDSLTTLLLSAQQGDRDALERFVAATHDEVLALCRYLGDADNYEDLAQQAYERAIVSLHRYRASGPARHWLLTIVRRTCVDATRSRIRRRRLHERAKTLAAVHDDVAAPVTSTSELDGFILALHPDRRAAFVLTQITGLSYEEAADVLGVPIGTVRSRVARARADLVSAMDGTRELRDGVRRPAG